VPAPVIPARAETIDHGDGRQSVIVHVDVLDLVNRVGFDEAKRIVKQQTGKDLSLAPGASLPA
jgi:hypothetical protein